MFQKLKQKKLLPYAYLLMIIVITVLPYFSVEEYSIVKHTTSELAAQGASNAWIMILVFILLGATTMYDVIPVLKRKLIYQILIGIFGASLILSGLFQHQSIDPGYNNNLTLDLIHSIFSTTTGISFVVFAIFSFFILKKDIEKYTGVIMGVISLGLSFMIFLLPDYAGIWQRTMFILSFYWLITFSNAIDSQVESEDR